VVGNYPPPPPQLHKEYEYSVSGVHLEELPRKRGVGPQLHLCFGVEFLECHVWLDSLGAEL
jgi:hypothetical protein